MNVEPPETLVIIESIVYKSNGFAIYVVCLRKSRYIFWQFLTPLFYGFVNDQLF